MTSTAHTETQQQQQMQKALAVRVTYMQKYIFKNILFKRKKKEKVELVY